jgi:hypothetical protein
MAKYTPPEQSKTLQWVDIVFLVIAIFAALYLPLKAGWAGISKTLEKIDNPTWDTLHQTPAMVAQWDKLGVNVQAAHDIIQNKWVYTIDWLQLAIMTVVIVGYFIFLFVASGKEYQDVIDEKFNGK